MRKLPKVITQEEFEMILKDVDNLKRTSQKRKKEYKIALLLGFEAGLRISEIVGYKDIIPPISPEMFSENSIKILGKGGKERVVPKPKRLSQTAINLMPLSIKRRSLQNITSFLGRKVLQKELSFHTLRHGFGSHLAGLGVPLHQVQMLMGHSRLDTTGIYLHANPKEAISKAQELF